MRTIRIGTRGSPLALRQTEMVCGELARICPDVEVEVKTILTSGDWKPSDGEVYLDADAGGKGQFAKEIELALLAGEIDAAVHSMKDMETTLPDGLMIKHMLPREDVRDALLFKDKDAQINGIDDLPQGAIVGTCSVRRRAMLLARRPDLEVVPFRGNVQTRIDKLRAGQVDATLLACAGLNRLGIAEEISCALSLGDMLPSVAQGAVGIELRENDSQNIAIFSQLNHTQTTLCVTAERGALAALDGSCHTPIGAYASLSEGDVREMNLKLAIYALDGSQIFKEEENAQPENDEAAWEFGFALGAKLKAKIPSDLLVQSI